MSCLLNYVGIGTNCDKSPLAINLNTIGISVSELNELISDDYQNGLELFYDKRLLAIEKVKTDILLYQGSKLIGKSLINNNTAGIFTTPEKILLAKGAGNFIGIRLKFNTPNGFIKSGIVRGIVRNQIVGFFNLFVYNIRQNQIVKTISIEANKYFQIDIDLQLNRQDAEYALVYDSVGDYSEAFTTKNYCQNCNGHDYVWCDQYTNGIGVRFNGTSFTNSGETGGVSIDWNISCDYESWMCSIGHLIRLPLAYYTAAQLMEYARFISPFYRNNTHTLSGVEKVVERYTFYNDQYQIEIKKLLQNMDLPKDDPCFLCFQPVKYIAFSL